jgi:CheY-like chemotaxis protein
LALRNLKADIAYDGEQALQAVKAEKPDVMVLDLRMHEEVVTAPASAASKDPKRRVPRP